LKYTSSSMFFLFFVASFFRMSSTTTNTAIERAANETYFQKLEGRFESAQSLLSGTSLMPFAV